MIWSVSKATRQAPSELMAIRAWASDMLLGLDDTWTAIQFDAAVSLFGVWIDNKIDEMDYTDPKHPRHRYTLDQLLNEDNTGQGIFERLKGLKGIRLRLKQEG